MCLTCDSVALACTSLYRTCDSVALACTSLYRTSCCIPKPHYFYVIFEGRPAAHKSQACSTRLLYTSPCTCMPHSLKPENLHKAPAAHKLHAPCQSMLAFS
jgi:hypothetical protein